MEKQTGTIIAVSRSAAYTFSKHTRESIRLLAGLGVEGDAHSGKTVKHRYLVAHDPERPNNRQVHLLHAELFDELREKGFTVSPGQMGENITTRGVDLLNLPVGTRLHIGENVLVELTGLRDPCPQIDGLAPGLMAACLDRDAQGQIIRRKAGVMGIIITGGEVRSNDAIVVELPPEPHQPLPVV